MVGDRSVFLVLVTISQVQKCFKLCDSKYIRVNYILYLYLYTCRLVQLSHFISKVSLCLRQWLLQKLRTDQTAENSKVSVEFLATNRISVSCSCHARLREYYGRGRGNIKRARGQGEEESYCVFWTSLASFTQELSADVLALHKIKTVNTPAWRVAGLMNLHPSAKAIES